MRILQINKFHYHRDGATAVYFGTAKLLNELGHDTAFFAMQHPKNIPSRFGKYFVPEANYNNDELGVFSKIKMAVSLVWNFQAQRNLEKLIKDFQPDVAHLHVIYHQLTPAIIHTLKKYQIPIVMTHHDFKMISPVYNLAVRGNIYEKTKANKYFKIISDKAIKNSFLKSALSVIEAYIHKLARSYHLVNVHISPSRFLKHKFREYGVMDKIEVVNNPYLNDQEAWIPTDNNYFLSFGRLSSEKGLDILLRAFAKTRGSDAKLYIAGTGLAKENLQNLSLKLGINNKVQFLGHLEQKQMIKVISKARAVVVPSRCYENFSMSIIEAMWQAKPVIATAIGGNTELIEDTLTGYLVPVGDEKELAGKIQSLIDSKDMARKMGEKAQERARLRYDKKDYIEKIIKIYEEVVRKNK